MTLPKREGGSDEELKASVEAYLDMQRKSRLKQPFVKKAYYQQLSQQFGRTAKSFEYRMQNISYVFANNGKDWLFGFKLAKNVGVNIAARIIKILSEIEKAH